MTGTKKNAIFGKNGIVPPKVIKSILNDPHLVQLFDLCSSCSWATVTSPKEAVANPLLKDLPFGW